MTASEFANKIVEYTFYFIFFLVPIIWLPVTNELFEFNKMIVVYFGTSIIFTAWVLKSIGEKKFIFKRTPLDIPLLIFLLSNMLSTLFSIDTHTSIFGYPTRLNGGLLSTLSYIILFYAFVAFFDQKKLERALKVLVASSAIVAVYAILQHPNPLFRNADGSFRGIDADFWHQNSQARVFSTLGHPNWLAAFILMLTPFVLYLLSTSGKLWEKHFYTALAIAYFTAFTFTYSRGGTLGFITMLTALIFGLIIFYRRFTPNLNLKLIYEYSKWPNLGFFVAIILSAWLLTFAFFGNAFTSRGLNIASLTAQDETQLVYEGSETGKIRLIVWSGALDIFKNFFLLGSGVETFAYSYYLFRPIEHNLTSEWDFLYNKAHNEFLNYLSTTGLVGFGAYIFVIITFFIYLLTRLRLGKNPSHSLFYISALASYSGYHVQNFFGFSVVATALLFFLIPAFSFVKGNLAKEKVLNLNFLKNTFSCLFMQFAVFAAGIVLICGTLIIWVADYYYTTGINATDAQISYNDLKLATRLRPDEPLYKAALGLTSVSLAISETGGISKERLSEGFSYLNQATRSSPNNINIIQVRLDAIRSLAILDKRYLPQMLETAKQLAKLAPTEAKKQYNLGEAYVATGNLKKAQQQLEKVVELKFNYNQAWQLLLQVDRNLKDEAAYQHHKKEYESIFKDVNVN